VENAKKLKIAFVIDTIQQMGGTERQLILLLENLNRSKFEPYLCCLQDSQWLQQHAAKWKTHIIHFRSFYYPISYWQIFKLSRYFKREGIQIVQTYFRDANIIGIIAARLAGIKKIISSRRNQGYWHNSFELSILKLLNPLVKKFLANNFAIKEHVNKSENVPLDKIDVIYNAIDVSLFSKAGRNGHEAIYKELKIKAEVPVITIVANLRSVKAIDDLINAARIVVEHNPDVHFLVVGKGSEKEKLQKLTDKLGLSNYVHFLDSRKDIPELLAISHIGVLCSESEGMSNALLEYMASSLPVVVTDIDGNRELVKNNENGFLVPVHNPQKISEALIRLLDDKDNARRMGQKSLDIIAANFKMESVIKKTETYYLEF
jgi:glycosyltransferase involved in cell wall biosynthesis